MIETNIKFFNIIMFHIELPNKLNYYIKIKHLSSN